MTKPDVRQRLAEAVRILDGNEGTLKDRLATAYVSQLLEIEPERDMPPELQEGFKRLRIELTQDEVVGDTGRVSDNVNQMSDEQVRDIAQRITELHARCSQGVAGP